MRKEVSALEPPAPMASRSSSALEWPRELGGPPPDEGVVDDCSVSVRRER